MKLEGLPDHFVYSPATIEFMTVVVETCLFLEKSIELSRKEFVEKGVNILSLLYLKTSMLEIPERSYDDETERFVTEEDYNYIKSQIEVLLGDKDTYLETFHPDMAFSDTPIAAFISENIADIYQELKDLAANYQLGETEIMNDAIATCLEAFGEHWGQKLLNALRAIHNIKYSNQGEDSEDESTHYHKDIDRNDYIDFLRDDDF
jgi:hypothetical protein